MECPCGCEIGLDDNHKAHSYSVSSLIKGCEIDSKEFDNPVPVLMKKSEVVEKAWFVENYHHHVALRF